MVLETDWSDFIDEYEGVEESEWYSEHSDLYRAIVDLLGRVPAAFNSEMHIEGLDATDVFGLSDALSSAVESQVVESLNELQPKMSVADQYEEYEFVRQSQTFPDVLFRDETNLTQDPLIGIELKCWYLLAKEGEPSFRFKTTPAACAPQDLLVIYPWTLDNVVTGTPEIFRPFIMPAKFASLYIDYYWQELKEWNDSNPDKTIKRPEEEVSYYPAAKTDQIQDQAVQDKGDNYGRFRKKPVRNLPPLREYADRMNNREFLGIRAEQWREFFTPSQRDGQINSLTDLNQIGESLADTLNQEGYGSPEELKSMLVESLSDIDGVGSQTGEEILDDLSKVRIND